MGLGRDRHVAGHPYRGERRAAALVGCGRTGRGESDYGSISRGTLVWGGAAAPELRVLKEKGKAESNPELCAKDGPIIDQRLVVDPKTKGVKSGFAYIVKPVGSNPEAYKALTEKHPKVEL